MKKILHIIFQRLISAGLTVSKEKCQFCRSELKYLGHVDDNQGLHVDPDKVKAILNIPTPKCVSDVRRIAATAGLYRCFIPRFSAIIAPMTALLKKHKAWDWNAGCKQAFTQLKDCLVKSPILTCPDFSLPFIIQTDASTYGLGAVLFQKQLNGEELVICYISRSLTRAERNYSTTEIECPVVVWAVEKLHSDRRPPFFSLALQTTAAKRTSGPLDNKAAAI